MVEVDLFDECVDNAISGFSKTGVGVEALSSEFVNFSVDIDGVVVVEITFLLEDVIAVEILFVNLEVDDDVVVLGLLDEDFVVGLTVDVVFGGIVLVVVVSTIMIALQYIFPYDFNEGTSI